MNEFTGLDLAPPILRSLKDEGYQMPTPIQRKAIPLLREGRDLLGIAQTGTGKTAAFTLPLLNRLHLEGRRPTGRHARALILAPTRELATQISASAKSYGRHLGLSLAVVMGGVKAGPQRKVLQNGVDILVATPGRLLDLASERSIILAETDLLVLDEADRMLDMGFIRDVRRIIQLLPKKRQTVLFSATMAPAVLTLSKDILHHPETVEIAAKSVAVERIEQHVHHIPQGAKQARLAELLVAPELEKVIVFTRTKYGADRVVKRLLKTGIRAEALHGNKSQNVRRRTLDNFRKGRARVLVATDIASRGIDVDNITHVVNFDLPREPESYVHRIGRTARAGADGTAISLCDVAEHAQLRAIERLIKRSLTVIGEAPPSNPGSSNGKRKRPAKHRSAARRRSRRSKRAERHAAA